MTGLTFGWALAQMKSGARVRRQSWSPSLSLSLTGAPIRKSWNFFIMTVRRRGP